MKHNNRELAHRAKKLDSHPPAPASIRARARYAEYCARKGALPKANQAMTSDLTPSAAPNNIDELRAKNLEPTHPTRDPITQPASLIWPQKADTSAWWEEEERQEYKHFTTKVIAKYFRTRWPVSAADVDGWRARELMAPLSSQNYQTDAFRFKREAFLQSLKSKIGLAASKAAALTINLNIQGCGIVSALVHAPSCAPLLLPLLLSTISLPPAFTSA
jgi:hypothetical protein